MSFGKIMQWRVPYTFPYQRWIAHQPRPVRFGIGAAAFCVVYVAINALMGRMPFPDHLVGMLGGGIGCGIAHAWLPPRTE